MERDGGGVGGGWGGCEIVCMCVGALICECEGGGGG